MIELLRHPLFLLFVGAIVSGLLVPGFTRRWQNRQKALEIKTGLVSDLSKSIAGIVMATQFARLGTDSQTQADFDQAYRSWEIESAAIGTELQAYFSNTTIPDQWAEFSALVTDFYALEGVGADSTSRFGAYLAERLGVSSGYRGPQDWIALRNGILKKKSGLIQQVLDASVSVLK